jgi:hypothetical protein
MAAILFGEEKGIPPKARWHNAAVVAGEGINGLRGTIEGTLETFIKPELMRYAIITDDDNGLIVAWESFENAGSPAERLEIQLIRGVHCELFLQLFAKAYGGKYVFLPYRGGDNFGNYRCYHLAPAPNYLLEPPALMGFGGACAVYGQIHLLPGGNSGVLMGP